MEIKRLAIVILCLFFVQLLIVIFVTLRHKSIFEGLDGKQYFYAIKKLGEVNPYAAHTIKGCYLAALLELAFLFIYKNQG